MTKNISFRTCPKSRRKPLQITGFYKFNREGFLDRAPIALNVE